MNRAFSPRSRKAATALASLDPLHHGPVWLPIWLLLGIILLPVTAWASLNAHLDRNRISMDETVVLDLEFSDRTDSQPDITPLRKDFDILGSQSGNRMSIVNGQMNASSTWSYTLSPKHSGSLTIPALKLGQDSSPSLTLEVTQAKPGAISTDQRISLETEVAPFAPYVQGQVIYTIRLFLAEQIADATLSDPEPDNTLVRKLGKDRQYSTRRDGIQYQVVERAYALFPQASGTLDIPSPQFTGKIADHRQSRASPFQGFFSRDPFNELLTATRPVRVRGEAHQLEVQPRPAQHPGSLWLPAQGVELTESWQLPEGELRPGAVITREIRLRAEGQTAEQLPDLEAPSVKGLRAYVDKGTLDTQDSRQGLTGSKTQKITYILESPGHWSLPEIRIPWWDTQSKSSKLATLPSRSIQVIADPAILQSATPQTPPLQQPQRPGTPAVPAASAPPAVMATPDESSPWPWISLGLGSGWLVTLLIFWRQRRETHVQPAPARTKEHRQVARNRFREACRAQDPRATRQALLDWARAHWPDHPPLGLQELAARLTDPKARQTLADLDRWLYAPGSQPRWNGEALLQALDALPPPSSEHRSTRDLPPLYSQT